MKRGQVNQVKGETKKETGTQKRMDMYKHVKKAKKIKKVLAMVSTRVHQSIETDNSVCQCQCQITVTKKQTR